MTKKNRIKITFLGSGNAFAPGRYWGSILLGDRVLLDASPIILPHLKKIGHPLDKIEYVFLTHLHGDHTFGLPFLFLEYYFKTKRKTDIYVIGPAGTEKKIELLFEVAFPDLIKIPRPFKVCYKEILQPGNYTIGNIEFKAIRMRHGDVINYGYKMKVNGITISYSGDTGMCDGIYELATDTDILILEASLTTGTSETHLSLGEIEQLRKKIPVKTQIIITHLNRITQAPIDLIVAEDMLSLKF
jgi:ribonuclease BN (tRNA processing enzyme)